jgi:hypothetical protein
MKPSQSGGMMSKNGQAVLAKVTVATIRAARRRAVDANMYAYIWQPRRVASALQVLAKDVMRLTDEVERLRG